MSVWSSILDEVAPNVLLGELVNYKSSRIPQDPEVIANLTRLAISLSDLKDDVSVPFYVTCGYIPSPEAKRLGYVNETPLSENWLLDGWRNLLYQIDYFFSTSIAEWSVWGKEKWTKDNPLTQGRVLFIKPAKDKDLEELYAQCLDYWKGGEVRKKELYIILLLEVK